MDDFAGNVSDPQSLHKYLYTHGDPVNGVDPSGEFTVTGLSVGIGIASTVATFGSGAAFAATGGSALQGAFLGITASTSLTYAYYTGNILPTTISALVQGTATVFADLLADFALNRPSNVDEQIQNFITGFATGAAATAFGKQLPPPVTAAVTSVISDISSIFGGSNIGFAEVTKNALIQASITYITSASINADLAVNFPAASRVLSSDLADEAIDASAFLGVIFSSVVGAWTDIGFDTFLNE